MVGVEPSGFPSLSVERTDRSVLLRPSTPVFALEEGTRYEVLPLATVIPAFDRED
jgi:hypothetical protein